MQEVIYTSKNIQPCGSRSITPSSESSMYILYLFGTAIGPENLASDIIQSAAKMRMIFILEPSGIYYQRNLRNMGFIVQFHIMIVRKKCTSQHVFRYEENKKIWEMSQGAPIISESSIVFSLILCLPIKDCED